MLDAGSNTIVDLKSDGIALKGGVMLGDCILAVNDEVVTSIDWRPTATEGVVVCRLPVALAPMRWMSALPEAQARRDCSRRAVPPRSPAHRPPRCLLRSLLPRSASSAASQQPSPAARAQGGVAPLAATTKSKVSV